MVGKKNKISKTRRLTLLFPGRFQPFHNAHFFLLKKLLKRFKVIVVIGSSDLKDDDNPFSAVERKKMIRACFPKQKIAFAAVPFAPDVTWVKTLKKAVPRRTFDLVFSNNPRVQKQLRKAAIPVIGSPLVRRNRLEGRRIRQWPKNWQKSVPEPVARILLEKTKGKNVGFKERRGKRSYRLVGTMNRT